MFPRAEPDEVSITAPPRPKIAESDLGQLAGLRRWCVPEQSEFHTPTFLPVFSEMITTWPWYGGWSPMYPPVVTYRRLPWTFSAAAIFSRAGRVVTRWGHGPAVTSWPL